MGRSAPKLLYSTNVLLFALGLLAPSFLAPATSAVAQTVVEVRVMVKDRSSQAPVAGIVYLRHDCPDVTKVDSCTAVGVYPGTASPAVVHCAEGAPLFAYVPTSGYYHQSTSGVCFVGDPVIFLAARVQDSRWLASTAVALVQQSQYGDALVLYSEANALQPSQALYEQVLISAAQRLNVASDQALAFDTQQKRRVASAELVAAIKQFQQQNGLLADGVLGQATMAKLAGNRPTPAVIADHAKQ